MKKSYRATYLKRDRWWIGWSDDVPGALTQGRTLAEVKSSLRDAIRTMLLPVDMDALPRGRIVRERISI